MPAQAVNLRIEMEPETDAAIGQWAERDGRSKRAQVLHLLRQLSALRKQQPAELQRLGLLSPADAIAHAQ